MQPDIPVSLDEMSKEEFDSKMSRGLKQAESGDGMSADAFFDSLKKEISGVAHKTFHSLNDDIIRLRTEVFVNEQGFHNEFDETDNNCVHIVLYEGGRAVAVCRYFSEGGAYHIGRVAVAKEYRGKNYGIGIMQAAEQEIAADFAKISDKSAGQKLIIELSAQCRVRKFYEKQGYVPCGDIFYDEYCTHIKMRKEIFRLTNHNR